MAEAQVQPPAMSMANTKKQILEAYEELVEQLQTRREAELKPEEKIEEKTTREAVETADALSTDGIIQSIGVIKTEMGNFLGKLTDSLE